MKYFKLNIGDIVIVNNRLFEVFLNRGCNGTCEFFTPNLKVVRNKKEKKVINHLINNEVRIEINKTLLNKKDYPINEEKIKKKNIFKNNKK